ncbi:uncharacterized protein LOC117296425 isoform X2 [Asterias rubens]|uniref:uncharacterized protein LOC117296425 isoform X2 n=1 Tax=Asterias rubens TaxID=7604 RepID=UPI001455620D|nr:uncharacterized protein LOC117296425 isoform X2 [Asterias rubens]
MSSDGQDLPHHQSSGSIGQMVPQRLSPSLIDLEHLSPEERSIILSVLDRDEQLRSYEQDRVKKLKGELHDLRKKSAAKESDENDNCRVCVRCREPLGRVFKSGDNCPKCQHRVCTNCQVTLPSGTRWLCTVCHKSMQLQLETGEWYYKKLQVDEVPLLGSDLVKASLAKAKQTLTDPTTAPVLTASDLRSKGSLNRGKGNRGRKQRGRVNSQSSSDYASSTTRESSRPSVRYENSSSDPNSPVISHTTSSSGVGHYTDLNSDPEDLPRGGAGIRWRKAAVVNQAGNRLIRHKGDGKASTLKPDSHLRNNSSLSATDSSEVDAVVVEPITGFTFQRVSFRRDRGKSDNTSKDSADQAYQLHEGMSSERSISDSGLEDSLCSGQTGGSSTNASPTDLLPLTSDPPVFHSYGLQGTGNETGRSILRSDLGFARPTDYISYGTDVTADTITQANSTPPVGFRIVSDTSTLETATSHSQSSNINDADNFDYQDNKDHRDLDNYFDDEGPLSENEQSGCFLVDDRLRGLTQNKARQTPPTVDTRKLLKISPNTAFILLDHNINCSESSFDTISESDASGFFEPIGKPNSIDITHSLNSMYLDSKQNLLKPQEGLDLDDSYFEDIDSDLCERLHSNTKLVSSNSEETAEPASAAENCRSNRNPSENKTNHFVRGQGSLDDSTSDSVCTPSDESDSLCELELDWDLRSSSPDFQEVQLKTKLKKNQLLMNELMKEAKRGTPDFFHRSSSMSSEDDVFSIPKQPLCPTGSSLSKESKSTEKHLSSLENSRENGRARHLRKREGDSCIQSKGDSDLSSSVSSWVDSDPSSDDNPSVIPTSTPKSSTHEAPRLSGQRTDQKVVIPRPNWAEMKAQQWKTTGPINRSFRSKRPGGRSEVGSQLKIVSEGPVLITEKNKGTYVVNPVCDGVLDSDSDSSSDDLDQTSHTRPPHTKKPSSRPSRLQFAYCSSSDSELSTIMEVSEEDQSALSLENSPIKTAVFNITLTHGVPSIVVSDQHPSVDDTEEDADDEAEELPQFLTPYYEPQFGWTVAEP